MKSFRVSAAVHRMFREYENLLLTASEFEEAADIVKRVVRNMGMEEQGAQAKDFAAANEK